MDRNVLPELAGGACVRAGELYEDYANEIGYMQPPAGLDDAGMQAFYDQLMPVMESYIQKALQVYQTAVEKAVSTGIDNEWVTKAADHLELLAPGTAAALGLPGYAPLPPPPDTTAPQDSTAAPDSTGAGEPQPLSFLPARPGCLAGVS